MHRVAVMGAGTPDVLPHGGAVVMLLLICGSTGREDYRGLAIVGIVSAARVLVAVAALGSTFGSF